MAAVRDNLEDAFGIDGAVFAGDGAQDAVDKRLLAHLEGENRARTFVCENEEEEAWLAAAGLITAKPVIYAANLDEDGFKAGEENELYKAVCAIAEKEGSSVLPICAKLEQDISELDDEDKALFMEELGLSESGLARLIKLSYAQLGLISYLTAGPIESKAWTIKKGTKAPQAAGKIHSDFERGFIKADVISYDDLIANGTMAAAREKGLVRSEGKEYIMQDGDVVLFKFNV